MPFHDRYFTFKAGLRKGHESVPVEEELEYIEYKYRKKENALNAWVRGNRGRKHVLLKTASTALFAAVFFYPTVARVTLQYWHCVEMADGSEAPPEKEEIFVPTWFLAAARHDSAKDFSRLDALLFTATDWILIPAYML